MEEDVAKRRAGDRVAEMVEDGMQIGIGTGSTAAYGIRAIGRRVVEEGLRIVGTPTSFFSERLARTVGIPLVTLDEVDSLDLCFDGADEVDPAFNLIKGRGAAQTRERVVAALGKRFVVLVDRSKIVQKLGLNFPVPVEVIPMAAPTVGRSLERLGADAVLRMGKAKDGPVVTDQGLWVIDARFPGITDPARLAQEIRNLPGVLDHGLFIGMATDVLVGGEDGSVEHLQKR